MMSQAAAKNQQTVIVKVVNGMLATYVRHQKRSVVYPITPLMWHVGLTGTHAQATRCHSTE